MDKRKLIIVVSVASIIMISFLGMKVLSGMKKQPHKMPPKLMKRYVATETVTYSNIESSIACSGRLFSKEHVDVISEVPGKILSGNVPLKKGQSFKKGDLLVKIYDTDTKLGLLAKKSRFLNLVANMLPDLKIDFPDRYQVWTDFFAAIDIEKDLPELPPISSNQEKIFLASRNITSDYFSIKSDQVRLEKYYIYAPFDGTYIDVLLEVGSIANPGSRIGKIIRTDKMELEVPIDVNNAIWLKPGIRVKVSTEDGTRKWDGRIVRKAQFVDPKTQSISIFVGLESNSENPLYQGLYLKATFPGIKHNNAMEITRKAVFNNNEVFTVRDGKLLKREIDVIKVNEKSVIFSGLEEGEEIVAEALINANENDAVEIMR